MKTNRTNSRLSVGSLILWTSSKDNLSVYGLVYAIQKKSFKAIWADGEKTCWLEACLFEVEPKFWKIVA